MLWLIGIPTFATAQPIQDERLDPIDCLLALEPLGTTFRSHLQKQCFSVPMKICELRGTPLPCLADTLNLIETYVRENRHRLPETIQGGSLKSRSYKAALHRINASFETQSQCAAKTGVDQHLCQIELLSQPTIEFFFRARQAGVTLER